MQLQNVAICHLLHSQVLDQQNTPMFMPSKGKTHSSAGIWLAVGSVFEKKKKKTCYEKSVLLLHALKEEDEEENLPH